MNPHVNILLLTCGIGRGHPWYLDGIAEALRRRHPACTVEYRSVFELATFPSDFGWQLARIAYVAGSQGGAATRLYELFRSDSAPAKSSWLFSAGLAQALRHYREQGTRIIVDHPLLAAGLPEFNVWYQHGELIAPTSALVTSAEKILVPTESVAEAFRQAGCPAAGVLVTGCSMEAELEENKSTWYEARLRRLAASGALTVGAFSSGAEPTPHCKLICRALASLSEAGHDIHLFAATGGRLHRMVKQAGEYRMMSGVQVHTVVNRRELHDAAMAVMGGLDLFLAPYHERIHWAVGTGLPLLGYLPTIGPFAPLNRNYARDAGVAADLTLVGADSLGGQLNQPDFRGKLVVMSQSGFGAHATGGFDRAADFIAGPLQQS